jgi:hypothetical protein
MMILRFLGGLRSFPPLRLLQNRLIQCQISYQLLKTSILLLQVLELPCLLHPQAAVLSAPVVIRLLGDPDCPAGLTDGAAFADQCPSLTELVDDLLRSELPSGQ